MASPIMHVVTTAPFIVVEALSPEGSFLMKGLGIIFILMAGVGIDIDYLSHYSQKELFSRILKREKEESVLEMLCRPVGSSGVNYHHSGRAVAFFSLLLLMGLVSDIGVLILAASAFFLHMFLDGANNWNRIEKNSPFPRLLYFKFFSHFPGLTYTSPLTWKGKTFEEWEKEMKTTDLADP